MRITVMGAVLIVAAAIVVVLVVRAFTDNKNGDGNTGFQEDQS